MTELLYLADAYLRSCAARVLAVDGARVTLDRTVLYAEGGGQAADHGTLRWTGGEARVVDSRYHDGSVSDVWHALASPFPRTGEPDVSGERERNVAAEGAAAPPVGAEVQVEVDWERRYGLMRHHTAAHVLSGILHHDYAQAKFTGGQLYPDRARFDFEFAEWKPELKTELESRVNAAIQKDYPVRNYAISRAEFESRSDLLRTKENLVDPRFTEIRITDIVGLDAQADGGTHVRSTKEVGKFVIDKVDNKGKGHRRLSVRCG